MTADARFPAERSTLPNVTTLDLHRLRLRPGEARDLTLDVSLEPFVLAGQRYEVAPAPVPVALRVSQASGATVLDRKSVV